MLRLRETRSECAQSASKSSDLIILLRTSRASPIYPSASSTATLSISDQLERVGSSPSNNASCPEEPGDRIRSSPPLGPRRPSRHVHGSTACQVSALPVYSRSSRPAGRLGGLPEEGGQHTSSITDSTTQCLSPRHAHRNHSLMWDHTRQSRIWLGRARGTSVARMGNRCASRFRCRIRS